MFAFEYIALCVINYWYSKLFNVDHAKPFNLRKNISVQDCNINIIIVMQSSSLNFYLLRAKSHHRPLFYYYSYIIVLLKMLYIIFSAEIYFIEYNIIIMIWSKHCTKRCAWNTFYLHKKWAKGLSTFVWCVVGPMYTRCG